MTTVRLHLDTSRVTIGDLMDLEDLDAQGAKAKVRDLHDILCKFVVGEGDVPAGTAEASALIRQLTIAQMMASVQGLYATLQAQALPPTTGSE